MTLLRNKIVSELNTIYLYIIQNLRLLRNVSDKELANLNSKYHLCGTDCYSCHFFEFDAGIGFIGDLLKNDSFNFKPTEIVAIFEDFKQYGKHNKL